MKLNGADALIGHLKKAANLGDVKQAVKVNTVQLQQKMQRNATFKGHYRNGKFIRPTGTTKRSIIPEFRNDGFEGAVGPQTDYAPFLIYGTRYMSSQDFFRPSFYEQEKKFIADMQRLMR